MEIFTFLAGLLQDQILFWKPFAEASPLVMLTLSLAGFIPLLFLKELYRGAEWLHEKVYFRGAAYARYPRAVRAYAFGSLWVSLIVGGGWGLCVQIGITLISGVQFVSVYMT